MSERNGMSGTATATHGSIDNLKDKVSHLVEQGQEKAGDIKNALVDAKDKVLTSSSSFIASSRNLIVDNPFVAIGVAFGVGYVAMRIFRR